MLFGLPDCDQVFRTYFDRWYSSQDRQRKGFPATRPDVTGSEGLKGLTPQEASSLTDEGQALIQKVVDEMLVAARGDWPTFLSVAEPLDMRWIDAFDRFHSKRCVKALMKSSDPANFSNDFLVRCCEFGTALWNRRRIQGQATGVFEPDCERETAAGATLTHLVMTGEGS
jgi:hypothetical protein